MHFLSFLVISRLHTHVICNETNWHLEQALIGVKTRILRLSAIWLARNDPSKCVKIAVWFLSQVRNKCFHTHFMKQENKFLLLKKLLWDRKSLFSFVDYFFSFCIVFFNKRLKLSNFNYFIRLINLYIIFHILQSLIHFVFNQCLLRRSVSD